MVSLREKRPVRLFDTSLNWIEILELTERVLDSDQGTTGIEVRLTEGLQHTRQGRMVTLSLRRDRRVADVMQNLTRMVRCSTERFTRGAKVDMGQTARRNPPLFLCQLRKPSRSKLTHIHAGIVEPMAQLTRHHTAHTMLAEPIDSKTLRIRVTAQMIYEGRARASTEIEKIFTTLHGRGSLKHSSRQGTQRADVLVLRDKIV